MSEVENQGPSLPESDPSVNPDRSQEPNPIKPIGVTETSWQTVDFPNALSLDGLPLAKPTPLEAVSVNPSETILTATLRQENAALRLQITQLEEQLAQLQGSLQDVSLQDVKETTPIASLSFESSLPVQIQISRLFQELALSHQANQRQQVVIETLQAELEKSQAQLAEMEQSRAQSQQEYAALERLRSQAEEECSDLRMRLHRQQQQTLQFKVALERALENATSSVVNPVTLESVESTPSLETTSPGKVTSLPVQPWTCPDHKENRFNQSLLKPLVKLLEPEAESEPVLSSPVDHRPSAHRPINELGGEAQGVNRFPLEVSTRTDHGFSSEPSQAPETELWSDLAKLIEVVVPTVVPGELSSQSSEAAIAAHELPLQDGTTDGDVLTTEPVVASAPSTEPAGISEAAEHLRRMVSDGVMTALPLTNPHFGQAFPSPTLYPERLTKKRQSLAAVELPTFPRRGASS